MGIKASGESVLKLLPGQSHRGRACPVRAGSHDHVEDSAQQQGIQKAIHPYRQGKKDSKTGQEESRRARSLRRQGHLIPTGIFSPG